MIKILIADDDKNLSAILTDDLTDHGFHVTGTDSGAAVLGLLEKDEPDVLLLDLNLPDMDGMDVLKKVKSLDLPAEVIVLTGHATVTTAVEAMKLGAYDYLTKPFKLVEVKAVVEKAYEKKKLRHENALLKTHIQRNLGRSRIITASPLMAELLESVKKVAASDLPILIYGESGVGKELVAMLAHDASGRTEGPFVPVNCGAIPENMIESELFGHEKGAFTGAYAKKPGLLEIADNGTLFLDEIAELSPQLQVKFLRVIETKSFFRVGGVKEINVDVKFLFATNRDLKTQVDHGDFRHDLYYRISALTLHIPPLRERKEDIPLLVEHFTKNNPSFRNKSFTLEALEIMSAYSWPGNVRELQNVIQRTLLLSPEDIIGPSALPPDISGCLRTPGEKLADVEREHILKIFGKTGGQKGKTAEMLGIDPKTLHRKLSGYGIRE